MPNSLALLVSDWYWEQDEHHRYQRINLPPHPVVRPEVRHFLGLARWELPNAEALNCTWETHRAQLAARRPFKDLQFVADLGGDGQPQYVSTSGAPRFDAEGRFLGYHGTTRLITEEWQEKRKLQETQRLLLLAARTARFGGWSLDLGKMRPVWSDEVCAIHGVPAGFTCSVQEALDFYAPEYRQQVTQLTNRCAVQGLPFDIEAQIITAGGCRVWVRAIGEAIRDEFGTVRGMHGAMQDIEGAKQLQGERLMLAERLRLTLDSLADGVFAVDAEWRFIYANPEAGRIAHIDPAGVIGRTLWEMFPQLLGTRFESEYRRAMRERVTVEFVDNYSPLGLWARVRAWPTPEGLAVCIVDITAQKTAEAQLHRLNKELEDRVRRRTAELQEAAQELQTLTYAIAHDVRTPLVTIKAFAQALQRSESERLSERGLQYLERIVAAASTMNAMTEGLLELGRLSRARPNRREVDLTELAQRTWDTVAAQDVTRMVEVRIAEGMRAQGDPAQLALVLQNLLCNAWKFTATTAGARVEVGELAGGTDRCVFFVRDNGVGFDPAYAAKLFQPFQRLHGTDEFPGTGLGLATVHKIVQLHGGELRAESTPACGATFFFSLPRSELRDAACARDTMALA